MIVCTTIAHLREQLRILRQRAMIEQGEVTVGFVPTMGYLHAGHGSLLARARSECNIVVLSIFVNPLQFAPGEDLAIYPRDTERDLLTAAQHQVDLVFMPEVNEMYPEGRTSLTSVQVAQVSDTLCGASRPGHFTGVATVVSKLFHIAQPDRAYFGLKDAQQVAVIEQMVRDLNIPVTIIPCPTVRETDGLALSSRNVYLSMEQRAAAPIIARALTEVDEWLQDDSMTFQQLRVRIMERIDSEPFAQIDYIACLQYPSFAELPNVACGEWLADSSRRVLIAVAVKFGTTRLIDNRLLGGGHRV